MTAPAGNTQVGDTVITIGPYPRDNAGFSDHGASLTPRKQVVPQQANQFRLQGTVSTRRRGHGDRFAVNQLPGADGRILRVPGEKLGQRHVGRRTVVECDHDITLTTSPPLAERAFSPEQQFSF
jgi:hypothetical protein